MHVNCALWSSEVYEEVDGSLQNVGQALSRGSRLLCSFCRSKGASVGCCHDNCKSNYHFACGVKDGAAFKNNKGLYCRFVVNSDIYPVRILLTNSDVRSQVSQGLVRRNRGQ